MKRMGAVKKRLFVHNVAGDITKLLRRGTETVAVRSMGGGFEANHRMSLTMTSNDLPKG
jgi:hypothetical protein